MGEEQLINEALLEDVLAIYTQAEIEMLEKVSKRVAKGITTEGWNEKNLAETQKVKAELEKVLSNTNKLGKSKVSKGILEAYKNGINNVKAKKGKHKTILDDLDIPMNLKMQVLATNQLLDNASFQVLRNAEDSYRQVMANATSGLLAGTDSRVQASQKMLNEFASKGITTFVDKAGRNWNLSSYAEMCARTVSSHAALQGHIDRQLEVGEDLIKVSTIGTTCPICSRWQGVVLSISGNNPKYHSLETAKSSGLFHPNCKHTFGMFIPELDGEGKVEPNKVNPDSKEQQRYNLIEKQRANERSIRYWKRREALAITDEERAKAQKKIKYWQYTNLLHCGKHGLQRQYAREALRYANPSGPKGPVIGGTLKEYEDMFKDVVGENPKPLFKMNLQFFANESYEKWLKDEIHSLDQLDIDKAQMKDSKNKAVTPTSLYKKYIGDNPGKDYALVSPFEKGSKEYKSDYAAWLKEQIDEIGVSYKVKPEYKEVHEDIPVEDIKLSATELYKKYHDGKKPTEAFKEAGGEEGTGMKYGKWVETQKKVLIKEGITKKVPFNKSIQKTVDTISEASATLQQAKAVVKEDELVKYKKHLEDTVHGNYDGYLAVKEALENLSKDMNEVNEEKFKLAKEKHLEMVEKKAKKMFGTSNFDKEYQKLADMFGKEQDVDMEDHIKAQMSVYEKLKKEGKEIDKAKIFLEDLKDDLGSHSKISAKMEMKDAAEAFGPEHEITKMYKESFKMKLKAEFKEELINGDSTEYAEQVLEEYKENLQMSTKPSGKVTNEAYYEALKEVIDEHKKALKEKEKKAKQMQSPGTSQKVSIGHEQRINEGHLVELTKMYQDVSREELEKISSEVKGHTFFTESRRDILGRDARGRNHHMGHDVRVKSGLSGEDKELAEAFQIAYDDYFNTIKCQDINLAYLKGYSKASPTMKKKIDAMKKVINSCELNESIKLHRFTSPEVMEAIFKTTDFDSIQKYDVFDNNTFMSTSTGGHPSFGERNYKLTLLVDKGTHALPTLNHEELEVLLNKGKLQFIEHNTYTSSDPQMLKNYDGTYTKFTGHEVVVRYIEDEKAYMYEKVDANKIDELLGKDELVTPHKKESKPWIKGLSSDEMTAVKKYTGSWYTDMNDVYRRDKTTSSDAVKHAHNLTKALRRFETEQPVVLRRGIYKEDLAHMLGFQGDYARAKKHFDEINNNPGKYAAEDKGFLSTSPEPRGGFTSKPVELRIYCPTGSHAPYVDSISTYSGEKETLLQSGSIYKVHKIEETSSKIIAHIELLGTD